MWAHSWHPFELPNGMNGMRAKALVLSTRSVLSSLRERRAELARKVLLYATVAQNN